MTPAARLAILLALALAGILALGARADERATGPGAGAPRSPDVLLFIGDGMGPGQVALGRLVKGAPLALDAVETTGLCRTDSLTGPVTDSAAAITAIACGVKTRNKTLGVDGEGAPVRSVAEDLASRGYRVGIVTTTRVTHATPAGFYGHAASRHDESLIALQLVESGIDVCLGGGARVFGDEQRAALAARGVEVISRLPASAPDGARRLLGLFAPGHLPFELDRAKGEPTLAELTSLALAALDAGAPARRPFLLLVEGGRIDHACHGHDAATTAREVIAFDEAAALGIEFARRREALLVATADHATGGLAISEKVDVAGLRRVRASTQAMLEAAGGDAERLRAVVAEKAGIGLSLEEATRCVTRKHRYSNNGTLAHLLSSRLGVHYAWTPDEQEDMHSAEGHDAMLVPVYSLGPGAERFRGTIDNTDIARGIRAVAGAAAPPPARSLPARPESPAREF